MMNRILVVGQTPPPLHGQAIMIEQLLKGDYGEFELHHVRRCCVVTAYLVGAEPLLSGSVVPAMAKLFRPSAPRVRADLCR